MAEIPLDPSHSVTVTMVTILDDDDDADDAAEYFFAVISSLKVLENKLLKRLHKLFATSQFLNISELPLA